MTAGPTSAWEAPQRARESADFAHSQYPGYVFGLEENRISHIPITSSRYLGTL